ncbi:hypothetical protein HMSSN139_22950 [Paenibacillus sp. HMSSN-139]|nr:hypothetical protein HMSSN139_22950 [Paenibacillus sp. HMSSN-139]
MIQLDDRFTFEAKSNDLLTIGELLVDMIANDYGDESQGDGYTRFSGGSPSNIAINANKLGIRSRIVSAVGRDGLGTYLIKRLEDAGMDTDGNSTGRCGDELGRTDEESGFADPDFLSGCRLSTEL